jgi:ADP-ribose pyrophosphatase
MSELITHHQGRYLSLVETDHWEYVTRSNAHAVVVIIALTGNGEIVLVEQYRRPVDRNVIELPAGLVGDQHGPHEQVLEAARRELIEETGFEAGSVELVMESPSSAGMTDEIVSFIRARGLVRIGSGGGDDSEDIVTHTIPLDQADRWLEQKQADGLYLDPKIFTALYWLSQESG